MDTDTIAGIDPNDPLFVFEHDPALASLETDDLRLAGGVRENVDGFEDLANKFTVRSINHTFSMAISLEPDPADGTSTPPIQRTGWSGDGAPSLFGFLEAAIIQHYPTELGRVPGVAFRLPTDREAELVERYQLSLGRTNELDLAAIHLSDPGAEEGRLAFLDPMRGRCNVCHANAGANSEDTGANTNFDTGTRRISPFQHRFDGGFGGQGLAAPNFDAIGDGTLSSFGDGTFNTPVLVEAADTGPFFHNNRTEGVALVLCLGPPPPPPPPGQPPPPPPPPGQPPPGCMIFRDGIELAIAFYNGPDFANSPAGQTLTARFGARLQIAPPDIIAIGRFLRVLNAAFNLDLARQRLNAAKTITRVFRERHIDVQYRLIELARAELDDAREVLNHPGEPLHPEVLLELDQTATALDEALSASSALDRKHAIADAISSVENAQAAFGTNINFELGEGNLMF